MFWSVSSFIRAHAECSHTSTSLFGMLLGSARLHLLKRYLEMCGSAIKLVCLCLFLSGSPWPCSVGLLFTCLVSYAVF